METGNMDTMSFWDHLDTLRGMFMKIVLLTVVFGIVAFFFKEELFGIILAPQNPNFIIYKFFGLVNSWLDSEDGSFSIRLINTGLAQQFTLHMKVSIYAGFLVSSPFALYQFFRFIMGGYFGFLLVKKMPKKGSRYITTDIISLSILLLFFK